MGEEYEVGDEIERDVSEYVKLNPNSPFNPEFSQNPLEK